jgi:hypothetical protein
MDNIIAPRSDRRRRDAGDHSRSRRSLDGLETIAAIRVWAWVCVVSLVLNCLAGPASAASPAAPSTPGVGSDSPGTSARIVLKEDFHQALSTLLEQETVPECRTQPESAALGAPARKPSARIGLPAQPVAADAGDDCLAALVRMMEMKAQGSDDAPASDPGAPAEEATSELEDEPGAAPEALASLVEFMGFPKAIAVDPAPRAQAADERPQPALLVVALDAAGAADNSVVVLDGSDPPSATMRLAGSQPADEVADRLIQVSQAIQAVEEMPLPLPEDVFDFEDYERPMSSITTDILPPLTDASEEVNLPSNRARRILAKKESLPDYTLTREEWIRSLYEWEASWLCHRPLYFEEVNLERYGYSRFPALQPVVSGARFFATAPILPYTMTVDPPREGIYALGHYRPGNLAPYQFHWIPLRANAAAVEGAVITGLIFAIP